MQIQTGISGESWMDLLLVDLKVDKCFAISEHNSSSEIESC